MKVPSNIIVKSQYTVGKEFIYADSYENYQGYYYEMNNKYFVGRVFDPNALEILKVNSDKVDKLKLNYNPILIKEVDEDTSIQLQSDPTYQILSLTLPASDYDPAILDEADKKMPGIKAFLLG